MSDKRFIKAEDLFQIKTVEDPQWNPDSKQVAFVHLEMDPLGDAYKRSIWLWRKDWDEPRRFTHGGKQDFSPRFSPGGERLAFVSTRNEKPQIFLIPLDGGEARQLTHAPFGATTPVWSPDGRYLAYLSPIGGTERRSEERGKFPPAPPKDKLEAEKRKLEFDHREKKAVDPRVIDYFPYRAGTDYLSSRYNHIYLLEVDNPEAQPQRLTQGDVDFNLPAWSPNGRYLWSWVARNPKESRFIENDLVRITAKDGTLKKFPRAQHDAYAPKPSPDGKWIACLTLVDKHPFAHLPRLTLMRTAGGGFRDLNLDFDRSVEQVEFYWTSDSQGLYVIAGDQGDMEIYHADLQSGKFRKLVAGRQMILQMAVSPTESFAYVACTPQRPPDLYITGKSGRTPRRLTDFNDSFLETVRVAPTEEIKYKAPDGTDIQGWIVKPPDFSPQKKWPLALNIHGGPHVMWGPSTPSMWIEWQLHAARGYVVFYCNPRGSDGYGDAFRSATLNAWGELDMPDILTGIDHVVAQGYIDSRRMAITGGSYGGFMTVWIIGHDRRFAAAVSQRGVYQLTSFYGTTDIPMLIEHEFGAYPFDDPDKMWKYSPFSYVRHIRTPLMILHSDLDYRAPISDAEQLYTSLKRLRRRVQLVRYPREGHELSRSGEPNHRVDRLNRMVAWFDRYCKPRKASE